MDILKRLFSSRKWVTLLGAIAVDLLLFWQLPTELAATIASFVTITAGIYITGQSVVDATGNHEIAKKK